MSFVALVLAALALVPAIRVLRRRRPSAEAYRRARATQLEVARILRPANALPLDELELGPFGAGVSFHGRRRSGREALVALSSSLDGSAPATPSFEIEAPHAPRLSIRRRGSFDWLFVRKSPIRLPGFVVASLDTQRAGRTLEASPTLVRAIEQAFDAYGIEQLLLWDGKLRARSRHALRGSDLAGALELLDSIVAAFEPVPVTVNVLGGERRALLGLSGHPRCALCHEDVTGEEPDLVACALCRTVLHEGCWSDLGRCPVLGCDGREPERARSRGDGERRGSS